MTIGVTKFYSPLTKEKLYTSKEAERPTIIEK